MQELFSSIDAYRREAAKLGPDASGSTNRSSRKSALARAAMTAIEPLVELFLDLGITSPEAESLLRSLFVHKSREWLARQDGGAEPSDVRVSLVTGVHRNFVRRILANPPTIAASRQRKGQRSGKLLEAWHTDAAYLNSGGKPRDLPEKGPAPSFEALVSAYTPGAATGVMLRELHRSGAVQLLGDRRVRVRSRSMRVAGVNVASLTDLGNRAKDLLGTLQHNLRQPQNPLFAEALRPIAIDRSRLPVVREVINQRASAFLQALEQELSNDSHAPIRKGRRNVTSLSIAVIETIR
jgi:hypothetical protein